MNTKLKITPETTKPPSVIEAAIQLIKDNPSLFQDNGATHFALAGALVDYQTRCRQFIKTI